MHIEWQKHETRIWAEGLDEPLVTLPFSGHHWNDWGIDLDTEEAQMLSDAISLAVKYELEHGENL